MAFTMRCDSPVGPLVAASDGTSLIGLWMEGQKYFGGSVAEALTEGEDLPVFAALRTWLDGYFAGRRPSPAALPLAPRGSAFRQAVWELLGEIPYGECVTYGAIGRAVAARLGRPSMSGQAVGGAVGHNPISIIIPCHRVVGAGGSLTGYAGGLDIKIRLLQLEGVDVSRFTVPTGAATGK